MMPIAPLMIEHRLTDRVISLMKREALAMQSGRVDTGFIRSTVEFFTTYVDLCHHCKEEEILFKSLGRKEMSPEHRKILHELIDEHVLARRIVARMDSAKEPCLYGDRAAVADMRDCLEEMDELYTAHIEKEDRHFFLPSMTYFTEEEQASMLSEMEEFDKRLIHKIYRDKVEEFERVRGGVSS